MHFFRILNYISLIICLQIYRGIVQMRENKGKYY